MAVVTPPLFQTIDGVYDGASLGLPYRDLVAEGVVSSGDLAVTQRGAGANMSVDVAAGVAWVRGDDSVSQPAYRVYNDATVNLAVDAAHASLDRVDRVIAEVRDAAFSGVSTDWRLRVVTGTPAASPSAPSEPNNALTLALVSVPAGDTSIEGTQIADYRQYATTGSRLLSRTLKTSSTTISGTNEAGSNTIITAPTLVFDGVSRYQFDFYSPNVEFSFGTASVQFLLHDGTDYVAHVGRFGLASGESVGVNISLTLVPTAGARAYSMRAYRATADAVVVGGVGGPGTYGPAEFRVTRLVG